MPDSIQIKMPLGLAFITHRREGSTYVKLNDLLDAIDALKTGAVEAGRDNYMLDILRTSILESYAKSVRV